MTELSEIKPYPVTQRDDKALASIATLLKEATNTLIILRREFRGEALHQWLDGTMAYVQITKPIFVKTDPETEKPIKKIIDFKNLEGNMEKKEVYVPNDEAIEEILSTLKFMGMNQITLLTNIDEDTILDDLREFECKLAGVLALKQKEWGIDKELLPLLMSKLKTIVQDARYQACNGSTLKAIQKTVTRIEQYQEGSSNRQEKWKRSQSPYM